MAGWAASRAARKARRASIEQRSRARRGDVRGFQFAHHTGYQRLEVGPLRVLFDVGGAPPLAYSERAHASALAFELSSESERLIVNVGAARELEPAGTRRRARHERAFDARRSPTRSRPCSTNARRGKGPRA